MMSAMADGRSPELCLVVSFFGRKSTEDEGKPHRLGAHAVVCTKAWSPPEWWVGVTALLIDKCSADFSPWR